jgi:hypothetical protein
METKTAAQVVGGIAALFVGWKIYRKLKPSGTDKADTNEAVANTDFIKKNKAILDKYIKIKKPTYSDAMYAGWKTALYKAMDGVGTNFDAIKNIMGYMMSDTDIVKLIDTFGIMNRKTNDPLSSGAEPLSLPSWFNEELDANQIYQINKIFSDKRIGFRF